VPFAFLRILTASSTNTNAPTIMIAKKGSAMIEAARREKVAA
jgi:hypothetical protein